MLISIMEEILITVRGQVLKAVRWPISRDLQEEYPTVESTM